MTADDASGVTFDSRIDYSPFRLYADLRRGKPPMLVDLRGSGRRLTLRSARPLATGRLQQQVRDAGLVVLLDDDGEEARRAARELQARGHDGARALYGGLALWRLCFQESVVGETFLVEAESG